MRYNTSVKNRMLPSAAIMELMLFTCARSIHINNDRKELKQVLHFRFSFELSFPKLTSLSFSLRPSVLRHVMYTIVDRYDNERESWSKSNLQVTLDQ